MTDATAKPASPKKGDDKGEKKKVGVVDEMIEIVKTVVYALLIALFLRMILFQPFTIPSASDEPNLYQGDYIIVTKWSYGWSYHSIPFSPHLFDGRILSTPPKRGDIVVFWNAPDSKDYIKRLIGLPGDRIQLRSGLLYINGTPVKEKLLGYSMGDLPGGVAPVKILQETNPEGRSYKIQEQASGVEEAGDTGVYVVPPHCYFMMGDNRDNSADSRFDPGLPPGDPKLGGCAWNSAVDERVGYMTGVGFVPEENLEGRAAMVLLSWNTGKGENDPCCASLWKPWTWITYARPTRFFKVLQ